MLDLVAWVILIVLIVGLVALALFLAALPCRIAKSRQHPWVQGVTVAGWVTFFLGFVLWPLALVWAYVDAPAPYKRDGAQ